MGRSYHHVHPTSLAFIPTLHLPLHQIPHFANSRSKLPLQLQKSRLQLYGGRVTYVTEFPTSDGNNDDFYFVCKGWWNYNRSV